MDLRRRTGPVCLVERHLAVRSVTVRAQQLTGPLAADAAERVQLYPAVGADSGQVGVPAGLDIPQRMLGVAWPDVLQGPSAPAGGKPTAARTGRSQQGEKAAVRHGQQEFQGAQRLQGTRAFRAVPAGLPGAERGEADLHAHSAQPVLYSLQAQSAGADGRAQCLVEGPGPQQGRDLRRRNGGALTCWASSRRGSGMHGGTCLPSTSCRDMHASHAVKAG